MSLQNWKEENNALIREYKFTDFKAAMNWMQTCIEPIEELNHHAEWENVYNKVTVRLTTHDQGNTITEKDRKLAEALETVYCKYK